MLTLIVLTEKQIIITEKMYFVCSQIVLILWSSKFTSSQIYEEIGKCKMYEVANLCKISKYENYKLACAYASSQKIITSLYVLTNLCRNFQCVKFMCSYVLVQAHMLNLWACMCLCERTCMKIGHKLVTILCESSQLTICARNLNMVWACDRKYDELLNVRAQTSSP